jgi:hypothetical protein
MNPGRIVMELLLVEGLKEMREELRATKACIAELERAAATHG